MAEFNLPKKHHWYSTWWGVTILSILCLLCAAIIAVGLLIYNYWSLIKSGQGDLLSGKFYSQMINQDESEEIKVMRELLETRDDPYLGNFNSNLVVVVFFDFNCPVSRMQMTEMQKIVAKYGYDMKIIYRDFPMESLYPGTSELHEIASCAHEQGLYWLFSDYFFSRQNTIIQLTYDDVGSMLKEYGGNVDLMIDCLQSNRGKAEVSKDYLDGHKAGITQGTPTVFINGHMVGAGGMLTFDKWEELIKQLKLL